MNPNAVNQFLKGSNLFIEGEPVSNVAMIIKGRVLMHNEGAKVLMGSGAFLGISDLYLGTYQSTYTAFDDLIVFVFPVSRPEEMETILTANKDYHGIMVASFYKTIYDLYQIYQGLMKNVAELYQNISTTYQNLQISARKNKIQLPDFERFENLPQPEKQLELISDRISYYCACKSLPMDAVKLFYSYGNEVTMYQLDDQASIVNQQLEELKNLSQSFLELAECLVDDTENCLFTQITKYSSRANNIGGVQLIDILDGIIEQINKAEIFAEKSLDQKLKVNRQKMEEGYHLLLTSELNPDVDNFTDEKYTKEDMQKALGELKDSYAKLLAYAGVDGTKAENMMHIMNRFGP